MSKSKTVADYEDAVRRIANADVNPNSTSQEEILDDLRNSNAPQVTEDIARDIADSIVSEERVIEAIESSGELPEDFELDAYTNAVDDYDLDDRRDAVLDVIRDRVATTGDLENAIERDRPLTEREAEAAVDGIGKEIRGADRQEVVDSIVTVEDVSREAGRSSEPVFREDVESTASDLSQGSGIRDSPDRLEEVAAEASREIGAPSRQTFEREQVQAVGGAEAITPANRDDLTSQSATGISVIRDESGDPVAAFGGAEQGGVTPEQTAEELGAERYYGAGTDALQQVQDDLSLEQTRGEAAITLEGRRIRGVDLE